jgi:hypothetical protein
MISIKEEDVKKQEAQLKELRKKLRQTMDEYERIDLNPGPKRLKGEDIEMNDEAEPENVVAQVKEETSEETIKNEPENDIKPEVEQLITA